MYKILGILTAVVGVAAASSLPAPAYATVPGGVDEAAVQRVVAEFAHSAGYPGIAYAVTDGERVLYADAYGDVTARTPMPIASLSKSFTALAVMQLVEGGRVDLDVPVGRYLTGFRIADPRGDLITVRQLLNQTSGLSDRGFPEKSLPQPDSPAGAVRRVRAAKLTADPGTAYAYTNTNYHLAARIVEVVSGQPFDAYLREHVFTPAGMTSAFSIEQTPRDLPADFPKGHVYAYGAAVAAGEPTRFVGGSDGVVATAEDLAKWLILQHRQNGLVSEAAYTTMHTPPAGTPQGSPAPHDSPAPQGSPTSQQSTQSTYAMGWQRDPDGRLHHNGIWFTYTASQLLLPDGHGIVVLGDSGIGLANEGTDALADALATVVEGGRPGGFTPVRLITDLVFAAFTLLSLALGGRALRRARRTRAAEAKKAAESKKVKVLKTWLRGVLRFWPAALLAALPALVSAVFGGRDLTFGQLWYTGPALIIWLGTAAAVNLVLLFVQVVRLVLDKTVRPGKVS